MKYLFFLLLPALALAQRGPLDLTEEDLDPSSEDILIKQPERYQRHENMIYDFNSNLGIKDQRKYTGEDKNRFSIAGHVSGDYEHFNELLGFEASYMRRSDRYNRIWWGGQFFQHKTYFDVITQNHTSGSTTTSESAFQRPNKEDNTVMGAGLGVGYRFKLLLDFFETEDVFESIDVFANVVELNESFIDEKYRGFGLTTNYGIHKRANTSFFYGAKLSYNLASVTRDAIGREKERERSLSLGWMSFAAEIGFFY